MLTDNEDLIDLEYLDRQLEKYEGMPLIMLDGFFVAILSLDQLLEPSQWYEHIGLNESDIARTEEGQQFLALLTEYYYSILHDLNHGAYTPLVDPDQQAASAKAWSFGYMTGLSLEDMDWMNEAPTDLVTMVSLLSAYALPEEETVDAIKAMSSQAGDRVSEEDIRALLDKVPESLAVLANEVYEFKLDQQPASHTDHDHCGCGSEHHHGTKINPNDPCPCGSGKQYQQCCVVQEPGDRLH